MSLEGCEEGNGARVNASIIRQALVRVSHRASAPVPEGTRARCAVSLRVRDAAVRVECCDVVCLRGYTRQTWTIDISGAQ